MQDSVEPRLPAAATRRRPAVHTQESAREFGGTFGASFIMTLSHALMLYLWIAWRFYDGAVFFPASIADLGPFFGRIWGQIVTYASPTWSTFAIYGTFLVVEGLMAAYLPGLEIKGLPIPSRERQTVGLPLQRDHRLVPHADRSRDSALQRSLSSGDDLRAVWRIHDHRDDQSRTSSRSSFTSEPRPPVTRSVCRGASSTTSSWGLGSIRGSAHWTSRCGRRSESPG